MVPHVDGLNCDPSASALPKHQQRSRGDVQHRIPAVDVHLTRDDLRRTPRGASQASPARPSSVIDVANGPEPREDGSSALPGVVTPVEPDPVNTTPATTAATTTAGRLQRRRRRRNHMPFWRARAARSAGTGGSG